MGSGEDIEETIRRLPQLARSRSAIDHYEAAALIADDDDLFSAVAIYTAGNPDIFEEWPEQQERLVRILKRVKPFRPWFKEFYRGQPDAPDPGHATARRGFRSWTPRRKIAEGFATEYPGGVVRVLSRPVRAVSMQDIATWRMRLRDESQYPGEQAEWLVLEE